jgi:hypothetical protein
MERHSASVFVTSKVSGVLAALCARPIPSLRLKAPRATTATPESRNWRFVIIVDTVKSSRRQAPNVRAECSDYDSGCLKVSLSHAIKPQ